VYNEYEVFIPLLGTRVFDPFYYLVLVLLVAAYLGLRVLVNMDFGRVLVAIREDEDRTMMFGYDVERAKLVAFTIGGGLAGLSGVLYAARNVYIDPSVFELYFATLPVVWVSVGGRKSLLRRCRCHDRRRIPPALARRGVRAGRGRRVAPAVDPVPAGRGRPVGRRKDRSQPSRRLGRRQSRRSGGGERLVSDSTSQESLDPNVRQTAAEIATGDRTDTLLQTDELVKTFGGFTATDSVDFSVEAGELRCLIGPNGAGKSTLLKLITGTLSATDGSVYYDGHEITELAPNERVSRGISMKFQVPSVYGDLSVRENARLPIQQFADGDERERRVQAAIDAAGLTGHEDDEASTLSHGQQQQLEISMAASLEPDLLLLDEPVAGLSVDERAEIADRITTLNREGGIAFIVIEHDTDFVAEIADKVTVLHKGDIFREGSIEEIESDPAVKRIYLGTDEDSGGDGQ